MKRNYYCDPGIGVFGLTTRMGVKARLLDGYAERDGQSFINGREVEMRFLDNAEDGRVEVEGE